METETAILQPEGRQPLTSSELLSVSRRIEVTCPYEVYPDEWDEICKQINNLLFQHDHGKYSNVRAQIVTVQRDG